MGALVSILSFAAMAGFLSLPFFTAVDDQPDVHFAKNPAQLDVLKSDDSDALERLSFKTLLETRCKSLFTPFRSVWWLPKWALSKLSLISCSFFQWALADVVLRCRRFLQTRSYVISPVNLKLSSLTTLDFSQSILVLTSACTMVEHCGCRSLFLEFFFNKQFG